MNLKSASAHLFAFDHIIHGLERDDRVFDAEEERPAPEDRTGHGRVVFVQRRRVAITREDLVHTLHLLAVLQQNVVEFHHHLVVDGLARLDVFEVEEHLESAFGGTQLLEGFVDEILSFVFDSLERREEEW